MSQLAPVYQNYVRILIVAAGVAIRKEGRFTISNLLKQSHVASARDACFAYTQTRVTGRKRIIAGSVNGEIERRTKEAVRRVHKKLQQTGLAGVPIEVFPGAILAVAAGGRMKRRSVLAGVGGVTLLAGLNWPDRAVAGAGEQYRNRVSMQVVRFLSAITTEIEQAILQ